jgi:hypothetical protein
MFLYEYALAAALLVMTPSVTVEELAGPQIETVPLLRTALQNLAVDWEILDPREVRYVLARPEDLVSDVNLLRRRYADLADAPAVVDCQRFPERAVVNDLLAFNRTYRQQLDARQPADPTRWWELRKVLQETDQLYQVWDTVRDARCEYYYVTVRRQALKRLHETIGDDAYFTGQLPPPVPLWRFQSIK